MTTLLPGSTQASSAASTSSTVRARSSGSSALEAEVAQDGRGVPHAQAAAAVPVDLEQRPPGGRRDLDSDGVGAADGDGLLVVVDHVVQRLLEDVLVVGTRVRDRPRDPSGVREVLDARDAGEREADDVERVVGVLAGQPHLGVDPG